MLFANIIHLDRKHMRKLCFNPWVPAILTSAYFLIACSSDEPKDPSPVDPGPEIEIVDWEKLENFQERVYNIELIDNKFYGTGIASYFFEIDINGAVNPQYFWSYVARTGRYKFPVSNKVLVSRSETDLFLFPSSNVSSGSVTSIKMEDLDPNFRFFEDMPRWNSDIFGLTTDGIGLVPYRKVVNGFATNNPTFLMFESNQLDNLIQIGNSSIIDFEFANAYSNCDRIESFKDFFSVQVGNATFKINLAGEVSKLSDFKARSVEVNNKIYSFAHNTSNNRIEVLVSDFLGNNTSQVATADYNEIFVRGEYFEVNDEIILVFRNNIYWLQILNNGVKITELENQNLDSGDIYNVIMAPEEKVLISNICNTPKCGIFSKSLEDFFKPKQIKDQ
ncbi:hypothetical protein [Shivajiella indica]|uniref:Uncharacterized protein n=1 Tax=Shivajiella indica TaxID=872115 RepID=A0ABW5BDP8_9BACT